MMAWRCHRLHPDFGICGVLGSPITQSPGPTFHNPRFRRAFKDLIYLPLETGDAAEALDALDTLPVLGASVTMPLKERLAERLGAGGPINTLWRRAAGDAWLSTNTDQTALEHFLEKMPPGPVLVLGGGGVAKASLGAIVNCRRPALPHSRRTPLAASEIALTAPVGVIQATSVGMAEGDPLPFPEALDAALPSLSWAFEWVSREGTAFGSWAEAAGLTFVAGARLFEKQAELQSGMFVAGCGG
jgi:shikimate 5-dehydrogenase